MSKNKKQIVLCKICSSSKIIGNKPKNTNNFIPYCTICLKDKIKKTLKTKEEYNSVNFSYSYSKGCIEPWKPLDPWKEIHIKLFPLLEKERMEKFDKFSKLNCELMSIGIDIEKITVEERKKYLI